MSEGLPKVISKPIQFENGTAMGISNRWTKGQYCSIITSTGIVGCGIYDVDTAGEFDLAVAICKGTPEKPLVDPEDLFESKIVNCTNKAKTLGIEVGMNGKQAVEILLAAAE